MKFSRFSHKRGIMLVTVLFLTILISMFIGAAILVGPRTLGLASSEDGELTATAAAESGMQYALMRIRENPDWRGDGGGVLVTTPEFSVVENSGYVWGYMKAPNGNASMFRLRFNYENGAGGADQLDDSTGPRTLSSFVSVNNLSNSNPAVVPRASSDSTSTVTDPSVGDYEVPSHGICLIVEGLAGPGVSDFDPSQPNPEGFTQSKVVEGVFIASNLSDVATNAAAMSNSDLLATLQNGKEFKVEAKGGGTPRVRSRGDVTVSQVDGSAGNYTSKGIVSTKDATLGANYDNGKTTVETEDATNPFYELAWDDLKTADAAGPGLAAGTYVWWDDGSLHYYDMDYEDYTGWIKAPANTSKAGQVVFSGGAYASGFTPPSSLQISDGKIQLTGDLYVEPVTDATGTTTAEGIAIIPREGAPEEPPGAGGGGALAAGPALAKFLTDNPTARNAFFAGRVGDGSSIGVSVAGGQQGWNSEPASGPGADISWTTDGTQIFVDGGDYLSLQAALTDAFADGFVASTEIETLAADLGLVDAEGDLDLGTGDTTTPDDLEVEFKPTAGESATLSAEGNIRIGAKLKGKGASITSGGTLKVIGAGADLSATANAEEGVNMYAKGDITLSTLKETSDGNYEFKDIKLKGLVYTWGDFKAKLGSDDPDTPWGSLNLEGTLVAFGGDPANGTPSTKNKGKVAIKAEDVKLKFDPAYLLGVMKTLPSNIEFRRTAWTSY